MLSGIADGTCPQAEKSVDNEASMETFQSLFLTKELLYLCLCSLALELPQTKAKLCLMIKLTAVLAIYWLSNSLLPQQRHIRHLIIAGLILLLINRNIRKLLLNINKKAILVTGCDQGFGHGLAVRLDKLGFIVFAGCLYKDGEGACSLQKKCSTRLHVLQLDVSDCNQVENAFEKIKDILGEESLWGLVNNAGICYIGNSEIISTDDSLKIMDVNFRGPFLLCRKFLPLLRRSQGRIVNVSSNAGLAPVALMGAYCCSKSALLMLSEVLRAENERWGVKVSTIVPSGYKTGIISYDKVKMAQKWWQQAPKQVQEDFGREGFFINTKYTDSTLSSDFSPVYEAMIDGLLSPEPKQIYYRGFLSRLIPFLYSHLPYCLWEPIAGILTEWFVFKPAYNPK
ncbi:estradiol 17-beta-dehydrogenase 2-like [Octopus sinensis]|uniref:Estradiol 17-beta-dehydrogenase 2-like n=1 Tax=Octopus sinensis TaxID=2607531 RepID=A0A6P7SG98_9MOLL|nr:estradiol 17-beta-dehydrogenase 2-like [Octopus sinensis]